MKKEEFEKKMEEEGREYSFEQLNKRKFSYKVGRLLLTIFEEAPYKSRLSILEIRISYRINFGRELKICKIHTYSDAFDLAYLIVKNPEQYEDIKDSDINDLLGRTPFQFPWEPQRDILDFNDEEIEKAKQLVKSDCIHCLSCPDGKSVIIEGSVSGQTKAISQPLKAALPEISLPADTDEGSEPDEEPQDDGMLVLCGYLYYVYVNGNYDNLLVRRFDTRRIFRTIYDPCDPYQFNWANKNGLKLIPENLFQLAQLMAKERMVHVEKELTEDNRIRIYHCGLVWDRKYDLNHNSEVTMCSMAEAVNLIDPKTSWQLNLGKHPNMDKGFFEIRDGDDLLVGNSPLDVGKSIYYCAGYIRYLRESNEQEMIDKDRAWYHKHQKELDTPVLSKFLFELPNDLFLNVSLPFETAELLQERNCVSLCRGENSSKSSEKTTASSIMRQDLDQPLKDCFCIRTVKEFKTMKDLETVRKEVQREKVNGYKCENIKLSDFSEATNNNLPIGLRCIYLAAYIDYLRRTGQYEAYKEKRQMNLARIQTGNPALQKLLKEADHEDKASFYCVIEGERTVGKREIIDLIAGRLKKSGKIDSADSYNYSFEEAAIKIAHADCFEKRKLYVLSDLREFLTILEDSNKKDTTLTNRDILSFINILGRYQPETYIIVVCEERYARQFLQLSGQIQFLFGENVVPIENLPPEKIYDIYMDEVSEDLKVRILQDEGFKDKFVNYIAENRSFFPLENRELAEYLAGHANNEDSLELPSARPSAESADYEKQLSQFVGMKNIKKKIRELAGFMNFQKKAAKQGCDISAGYLNMIFAGDPGTGKTTIAKIMADMLYSIGIIKTNKLVAVERKDLVSEHIGGTDVKTSQVIQRALDGVLFIDEAYSLTPKSERDFSAEAISTLINAMGEYENRLVVIFAGYQKEMEDFVNSNPGIRSRIGYEFYFEDYTPDELTEMFRMKQENCGFTVEKDALDKAYEVFNYYSERKNFGNGRFVDELIQETYLRHAGRLSEDDQDLLVFRKDDIPGIMDLTETKKKSERITTLKDVVGLSKVKEELKKFKSVADFWQETKKQRKPLTGFNMNMVFYGNPGTGKSSVARIVTEELYSRGLIQEGKLCEANGKDLNNLDPIAFNELKGGVLLIDDAELLTQTIENLSISNALDIIMNLMKKNEIIVIFAGGKENIKEWLATVPHLTSSIRFYFDFEDCTPKELCEIYIKKMKESGFSVTEGAQETITSLMREFSNRENFENGRFVDRVIQETFTRHAQTCTEENFSLIDADDIPPAERMRELLDLQKGKSKIGFAGK